MTHTTEQERALSSLRHLYQQMAGGMVKDSAQAKRIAEGLLSPAIAKLEQAARRAPAAPVPQGLREAAQAVVERWDTPLWKDVPATAVYIADLRDALAAAPQPPDDLKRGNPATKPDEGPSSCAHCGNPWGEAAPIDPQLLQAIQCAGFQVIKGALGYELMKLGQAYAGQMDTNVRNWMNAALSKDVACPDCGLSGLHACPSASTAESQGADAVKALEKVLRAVQRHLPPERIGERETIAEIISIVDPWPLGKPPAPWKDHMTAELVGKLTDVARQFYGTQQLRERIAGLVRPLCERIKQLGDDRMPEGDMGNPISASAPAQLPEPVAAESRFTTFAGNRWRCCTVEHARAFGADKGYEVRYLYTEQQVRQLLADQQFKLDELAMLTRMVVHALRQVAPDNKTAAKAVDYLKRKGLAGNPLRAAQEQST